MEHVVCNLCGSDDSELLYPNTLPADSSEDDMERFRCTSPSYGQHCAIVKCRSCGLVYANPRRKERAILNSYEEVVDETYVEERQGDVIEHLTHPLRTLKESNRVLKEGGFICIHTMNIKSPFAKLMGSRWPWLMEMHLCYFSPRTLEAMLKKAGFAVIEMATQGRFARLGYLLSRLEAYSQSLSRGLVRLVTALGLKGLLVPINLGDLFTAYARKARAVHV